MSRHVLLVEPIAGEGGSARAAQLVSAGFLVAACNDRRAAVDSVTRAEPDVVVLDLRAVGKQGLDGFAVCADLRRVATPGMGIIVVADGAEPKARIAGLTAGADDVVPAGVDVEELAARVDALVRRADGLRSRSRLTGLPGPFELDLDLADAIGSGRPFSLAMADIDHFAPFGKRYGIERCDQAVVAAARLFAEALDGVAAGLFHLGADSLAVTCDPVELPLVLDDVCRRFDDLAPHLFDPHDAARGFFEVERRQGGFDEVSLVALSVGVASNAHIEITSSSQATAIATEMRAFSRTFKGSTWRADRRRIGSFR
jgi:DNA-binding response OmpR family regulator